MDDLSALRLQVEWGVDEALGSLPVVRLRAPAPELRAPVPVSVPAAAPAAFASLDDWHAALDAFSQCPLRLTATHTVRPDGNPGAGLVVIGEAPGAEDDRTGRAFAGAPGAMLDRILLSAGLDRGMLLLTHLVPWRPPGNRVPNEAEVRLCLPFLHGLLQLLQPSRLVLLGQGPVRAVLDSPDPVRRLRGRWHAAALPGLAPVATLCMLPPDQWLRSPAAKRDTWTDLLLLRTGPPVNPA